MMGEGEDSSTFLKVPGSFSNQALPIDPLVQRSPLGTGEEAINVCWKSMEQVGLELFL